MIAVHRWLSCIIEERPQLIELALTDRIVLVIVANRTAGCEPKEHGRRGFDAVDHVADIQFFRNRTAFRRRDVAAIETGRNQLIASWRRQQIARNLFNDKPVKRHVVIEGIHDPVAIRPDLTIVVHMHTMCVSVPRRVQPIASSMLSRMRRSHQLVEII